MAKEEQQSNVTKPESMLSKTNISELHWEIMQEIFSFLDGKSLIMCKRVSKSWKDHINNLEKKRTFWYSNCIKEIPVGVQFDLLDNIFPFHWGNQNGVDWQIIYKSWCFWDDLHAFSSSVNKFHGALNGISTIRVSGEWLLMSTCEGRGKLTAKNLIKNTVIDVYVGCGPIVGFELVKSDRPCTSNVQPSGTLEDLFNTLDHNEVWIELRESYVQLGKTFCHTLDKIAQKIRHFYGYEARLVNEGRCSVLYLNKVCGSVRGPDLMQIDLCNRYTNILHMWINKISLNNDELSQMDVYTIDMKTQEADVSALQASQWRLGEIPRFYSWHDSLFVTFTNKRKLIFQSKGGVLHINTPLRKECITSVLYYSSYLFLGTDRGHLIIYRVKDPDSRWNLSLYDECDPAFCWKIHVDNTKIVHISVAEPSHHSEKKPVIICASPEEVYLISFPYEDN